MPLPTFKADPVCSLPREKALGCSVWPLRGKSDRSFETIPELKDPRYVPGVAEGLGELDGTASGVELTSGLGVVSGVGVASEVGVVSGVGVASRVGVVSGFGVVSGAGVISGFGVVSGVGAISGFGVV
jgi:hypothetical protein